MLEIEQFLSELKQSASPNQILATLLSVSISQAQTLPTAAPAQLVEKIARFRGQVANQGQERFLATFNAQAGPSAAPWPCTAWLKGRASA